MTHTLYIKHNSSYRGPNGLQRKAYERLDPYLQLSRRYLNPFWDTKGMKKIGFLKTRRDARLY